MTGVAKRRYTPEEITARLNQANPKPVAGGASEGSIIRLSARRVRPYEHNPRTITNAKYAEIKESIQAKGIEQIITITKRPHQDFYITARGGNTRLTIVHDLFTETQDPRFDEFDFILTPYISERHLRASHLIENNSRSDLCFWDNATSILGLCDQINQDSGKQLSLRDLSEALKGDGVAASHSWLAIYRFAVQNLSGLGEAATCLSSKDIKDRLQPAYSRMAKLAIKFGIDEGDLSKQVYSPEIELARIRQEQNPARELDVDGLVENLFVRFSKITDIARDDVDRLYHIIDKQPELTADQLRELARPQSQPLLVPVKPGGAEGVSGDDWLPLQNGEHRTPGSTDGNANAGGPSVATAAPPRPRDPGSRIKIVETPPVPSQPATLVAVPDQAIELAPDPYLAGLEKRNADPRAEFMAVLSEFASACSLVDCIRECPALPLWYLVDPPVLAADEPALDTQAANGIAADRYYGWWWLVFISKQNTPAGLTLVPDGPFARICMDIDLWEQACLEIVGEQVQPDQFYRLIASMCDPADAVGPLYLRFIQALRDVRQAYPERFTSEFWIKQGVDPKFAEEV